MRSLIYVVLILLAGCAWNTPVQSLGGNTYTVSSNASPARGAQAGARGMALEAANKHCESLGKKIDVTNIDTGYAFPTNGVVTVTFDCN